MSHRLAGAALAIAGLLVGLALGILVGRETAGPRAAAPVEARPTTTASDPGTPASTAALLASLRRENEELRARLARGRSAGAPAARTSSQAPDGAADSGSAVETAARPTLPGNPAELLEALRTALTTDDRPGQAYLRALLEQSLQDGRVPLLEAIRWATQESDPVLVQTLTECIYSGLGTSTPDVVAALVAGVEQGAADCNRIAAIRLLTCCSEWPEDAMPRLLTVAKRGASAELRQEVLGALGRFAQDEDPSRRRAVTDATLQMLREDPDPQVRTSALYSINYTTASAEESRALLQSLAGDQEESVRANVAGVIPYVEGLPVEQRLRALEDQYVRDSSRMVREALLIALVATGRDRAIAALERIRGADESLRADVEDTLTILRSGVTDPNEVQNRRATLHAETNTLPASDPE